MLRDATGRGSDDQKLSWWDLQKRALPLDTQLTTETKHYHQGHYYNLILFLVFSSVKLWVERVVARAEEARHIHAREVLAGSSQLQETGEFTFITSNLWKENNSDEASYSSRTWTIHMHQYTVSRYTHQVTIFLYCAFADKLANVHVEKR